MSDRAGVPGSYDEDISRELEVTLLTATPVPGYMSGVKLKTATCECGLPIQLCEPATVRGPKAWLHVQTGVDICPAGATMGLPAAPADDDFYEVSVTVKMTRAQRDEYAAEYGGHFSVADDIASRLRADVTEALRSCYWLREFATYSVSKVR
jgi:hypothetical protein